MKTGCLLSACVSLMKISALCKLLPNSTRLDGRAIECLEATSLNFSRMTRYPEVMLTVLTARPSGVLPPRADPVAVTLGPYAGLACGAFDFASTFLFPALV